MTKKHLKLASIGVYALLGFVGTVQAQPKEVKNILSQLKFVEGGTFVMGSVNLEVGQRIPKKDSTYFPPLNARKVTVSDFWLAEKEVTNKQWRTFYEAKVAELGAEKAKPYMPDTAVWQKDFPYSYHEPMARYYFANPAFDDYPVVGVTWLQAQEYCQWLTDYVNGALEKSGSKLRAPAFRLPTEAEWEYAAQATTEPQSDEVVNRRMYPFGNSLINEKGNYHENFGTIIDDYGIWIKTHWDKLPSSLTSEQGLYTSAVGSFTPNGIGLYDMGGNVREWVQDVYRPIKYSSTDDYDFLDNVYPRNIFATDTVQKKEETPQPQKPKRPDFSEVLLTHDSIALLQRIEDDVKNYSDVKLSDKEAENAFIEHYFYHLWRSAKLVDTSFYARVFKGGSWADQPAYLQCASRGAFKEDKCSSMIGFRVAMIQVSEVQINWGEPVKKQKKSNSKYPMLTDSSEWK